jgi:hypothetical protein
LGKKYAGIIIAVNCKSKFMKRCKRHKNQAGKRLMVRRNVNYQLAIQVAEKQNSDALNRVREDGEMMSSYYTGEDEFEW